MAHIYVPVVEMQLCCSGIGLHIDVLVQNDVNTMEGTKPSLHW